MERPVPPCASRYLQRALVSSGRGVAGKLAHGPELAAVAGGMDAAGVGGLSGESDNCIRVSYKLLGQVG